MTYSVVCLADVESSSGFAYAERLVLPPASGSLVKCDIKSSASASDTVN